MRVTSGLKKAKIIPITTKKAAPLPKTATGESNRMPKAFGESSRLIWLVDEKLAALSRADAGEATTAVLCGGGMGPGRAVSRADVGEAATAGLPAGMDAEGAAVWAGRVAV